MFTASLPLPAVKVSFLKANKRNAEPCPAPALSGTGASLEKLRPGAWRHVPGPWSSPGSPTDVPAVFQEDSLPRRFGLTPGSPAPRPDLAPGSGSAAAPCSRLPCSLPSLSPLPPLALAQSWPLPTSLGPSPAFYKPSSFSRSPLSAPFLSPHRAPAPPGVRTRHWMPDGMRLLPAAGLEARGPRPQLDGTPGPDNGTSHPGPRHHQPLINRPTSAVWRSVGYRPRSCKGPGVATVESPSEDHAAQGAGGLLCLQLSPQEPTI
nr:uncharacterized protein LOC110130953 [Odocoileus virginianus texanus]